MADTVGEVNPLRYRGYVYDSETGLYYLQSRYYNPEIGRFINADAFTATGQGLLSNNMFVYCLNDPVNRCDPNGMSSHNAAEPWKCTCINCVYSPSKLGIAADIYLDTITVLSMATGQYALCFGVNNGINFCYYTWMADIEIGLEHSKNTSTYTTIYVTRWDRLDYTKQQTKDSMYGLNAWRYYSEYSMHMHTWYIVKPFLEKGINLADRVGGSAEYAHMLPDAFDENYKTNILIVLTGLLGI